MLDRTRRILAWYQQEWPRREGPEPSARPSDIAEAQAVCLEITGRELPSGVVDLWQITDGFDCNGFAFWATRQRTDPAFNRGFIEENQRDEPVAGYAYIGSSGDEVMALHFDTGRVDFIDRWSNEPRPMFPNLDIMVYGIIPAGIED